MRLRSREAVCAGILVLVLFASRTAAQDSMPMQSEPQSSAPGELPPFRPMQIPHPPRVTVQPLPAYGAAPLTVGFLVTGGDSEAQGFVSYRWDLGDGTVSTLAPTMLFHTYENAGSYVVTLSATTADGHTAVGFAGVVVSPTPQ